MPGGSDSRFRPLLEALEDRTLPAPGLVSISTTGGVGYNASSLPSLRADGRYVAFPSLASNLVSGDTNSASDLFVQELAPTSTFCCRSMLRSPTNSVSFALSITRSTSTMTARSPS